MQPYNQNHFVLHNYKKILEKDKNIINAIDGQGLANNYGRQSKKTDQFQNYLCHAQLKFETINSVKSL